MANKVNCEVNETTYTVNRVMPMRNSKVKFNPNTYVVNLSPKVYQDYLLSASLRKNRKTTFQASMKWTILIGQIFGIHPVLGACEKNVSNVRFSLYSGKCIYSLLSVIGQLVLVFLALVKIFEDTGASLASNTALIFYFCNCLITIMFIQIAKKWPELSRHVAKIESTDPCESSMLPAKCNITCFVIVVLGVVEHALSDASGLSLARACQPKGEDYAYEAFLKQNFYWVWNYVPYNLFLGVLLKILSIQCTFNWNYSDAFIMCMCFYLLERFQQINKRIKEVQAQVVPSSLWRTMREDYNKATTLVRRFDDIISGVIFVSFASNLFSICFLMLHVLEEGLKPTPECHISKDSKPLSGYEHEIYFIFSIVFLLVRSVAVSLIAAKVHIASVEPSYTLYEVPSEGYGVEVQRFLEQVHGDSVVLSGLKFFSVKRGMVLTIAATIVTYELVLIQFTGVTPTSPPSTHN